MSQWNKFKAKRRKSTSFITNHSEIEKAVDDYLKNGGKITKLEASDSNYADFIKIRDSSFLADEFLAGN